ncbi:hypothetical protein LX32DRAFT_167697 [Colletotrichum zoysiae]|uniref:Uncharacterized protein n=1 Tax=Colletotrichum zoysiae TaxID=1216348 RepID=A0AAD9M5M6_9PEZI|nr:hypothetical protein LX32DRAFT_167697 [Colletotrichum zoysiae]
MRGKERESLDKVGLPVHRDEGVESNHLIVMSGFPRRATCPARERRGGARNDSQRRFWSFARMLQLCTKKRRGGEPVRYQTSNNRQGQGISASDPNLVQGIGERNRTRHFTHIGSKHTKAQVEKRRNFFETDRSRQKTFPPRSSSCPPCHQQL